MNLQRVYFFPVHASSEDVGGIPSLNPHVAFMAGYIIFIHYRANVMGRETEKELDQMTYISRWLTFLR
jgi:hypothetical protein